MYRQLYINTMNMRNERIVMQGTGGRAGSLTLTLHRLGMVVGGRNIETCCLSMTRRDAVAEEYVPTYIIIFPPVLAVSIFPRDLNLS